MFSTDDLEGFLQVRAWGKYSTAFPRALRLSQQQMGEGERRERPGITSYILLKKDPRVFKTTSGAESEVKGFLVSFPLLHSVPGHTSFPLLRIYHSASLSTK